MIFAFIKKYMYAGAAAVVAFIGLFLYKKGRSDQKNAQMKDNLESMQDAKEIREDVQRDPHFVDRAKQWVKKD